MLSQRAQSSAPFEVLIAVIVMGFVLFMGAQAIQNLQEEQCKSQIKSAATDLKASVQDVVRGNSVLLKFFPPKCFEEETKMKLERVSSAARCRSICGREVEECLFFTYRSDKFNYDLCLDNAPTYTTFMLEGSGCPDRQAEGFFAVDFRQPPDDPSIPNHEGAIPRGIYQLQNRTGSAESVPKICAYHKEGN